MLRFLASLLFVTYGGFVHALPVQSDFPMEAALTDVAEHGAVDESVSEFDPSAPDAMETLRAFDRAYREETGEDTMSHFFDGFFGLFEQSGGCYRGSCSVFVNVVKSVQKLYLYVDGELQTSWLVSTAGRGHVTPNFDGHPSGPFYSGRYSSRKYPGGDYKGLGNMPYASFYHGGFAIHGTPSIGMLGRPASHGCVRSHPNNARYLSQLIRSVGAGNVWITVSRSPVAPYTQSGEMAPSRSL